MKKLLWNTVQNLPLIACKPRQENNSKTFDRTFEGGEVKRGHVAASSASVKKRRVKWPRPQVKRVSKFDDQCREREEGHIFSQSAMIHLTLSKNSLWYGELDFLPRLTWLYVRCGSRSSLETRWHFFRLFFFFDATFFSWLTREYHCPN